MVEVNALGILAIFGFTIIVGYAGSLIFHKTKIPDILWLLLFGIILGPVFNVIDRVLFLAMAPFLAALALMIILFDAGLNMDFYNMMKGAPRSMLFGVVHLIFSMAAVGLISYYIFGFDLMLGLLLGAIVGSTSSEIVISLANNLNMRQDVKMMMKLESIFTDPLVIVVSIALINMMAQNSNYSALQGILGAFSIGGFVGIIGGVLWLLFMEKIRGKPFDYMLTLAALFLIYVFVESAAGSGAIAALFFGLVLGNGKIFSTMLRTGHEYQGVNETLKSFQSQISFFIRSFFFVFLGMIVIISPSYLLYGMVIAAGLIIIRVIAVQVSAIGMQLTKAEKNAMRTMVPRGLAAAVLAQLPVTFGIQGAEAFSQVVFVILLATIIYTSIATRFLSKQDSQAEPPPVIEAPIEQMHKPIRKRKRSRKA